MVRARLLLLAVLLPLAGCATTPGEGCMENVMCAARAAEPPILAAAANRAERQGEALVLHPAKAEPLRLADRKQACENHDVDACVGFALMGSFAAARAWVVQRFHYEGSDFLLIDQDSGRQTGLRGMPSFSPDGGEFLVAPFDEESDPGPNNLEIWRRQGDGAVLEWAHPFARIQAEDPALPAPYQSRVIRWQGDRITLALSVGGSFMKRWTGTLMRDQQGWHLAAQSPVGLFAR